MRDECYGGLVMVKKVKTGSLVAVGTRERIDQRCCEVVTPT